MRGVKKKVKRILVALSMSVVFSSSGAEEIGCGVSVIPQNKIEYGCGCSYHLDVDKKFVPVFQAELDLQRPRMYIDGKLVPVTPAKIEPIPLNPKIGDKFTQQFSYNGRTAIFNNTITFVCPPQSESCEVISFDTKLSVIGPACMANNIEIKGDCGC